MSDESGQYEDSVQSPSTSKTESTDGDESESQIDSTATGTERQSRGGVETSGTGDLKRNDTSPTNTGPNEQTLKRRLNEREYGLDRKSEQLDERARKLDKREQELDTKREELLEWETQLSEWEAELDNRERNLDEYDDSLAERASELNHHEETLHQYLDKHAGDLEKTVSDSVHSAMAKREEDRQFGRFGVTGTVLIGLAGVVLAAGGVGYAVWLEYATGGGLFGFILDDVTLAGGLLIIGIGLTLLSVTTPPQ